MKSLKEQIDDAVKQIGIAGRKCFPELDEVIEKHARVLTEMAKNRIINRTAH